MGISMFTENCNNDLNELMINFNNASYRLEQNASEVSPAMAKLL